MFPLKSRLKLRDTRKTVKTTEAMSIAGGGSPCSSPRSTQLDGAAPLPLDQPPFVRTPAPSHKYLAISVLEARNLVAKDYDTHSSDPFVKITLGAVSRKTRAIYRNCHPMWEQRLVFPVDGLSEAEPLRIQLYDKDFNSKEFLGQVMMTLGKAFEIEADAAQRGAYWLVLSKQRSTDLVNGELCLGFELLNLDAQQHSQLLSDLEDQLSSEALATSLAGKALHIHLKGLNGLINSGLFGAPPEQQHRGQHQQPQQQQQQQHRPPKLSLFIKYGRINVEKQLPPPIDPSQATDLDPGSPRSCCDDAYEVTVNEEVVIPLAAAVKAAPLKARKRDELVDIKVYLRSEDTLIAKTQIPITSVPFTHSSSAPAAAPSPGAAVPGTAADDTPPTGASTPRTTHDGMHRGLQGGLETMSLPSHSVPDTPRGTAIDLVQASYGPPTPSSGLMCDLSSPSRPASTRPDAAAAFSLGATIHKRFNALGGWVGSSSSISSPGGSGASPPDSLSSTLGAASDSTDGGQGGSAPNSLASTMVLGPEGAMRLHAGTKAAVEGSLDSVTAYSSARGHHVHAPAGLLGRRVQGLAEMHESSANVLRKPLKAMFVPPREVNRLGWVKAAADPASEDPSNPASPRSGRPFCRILDPKVPTNPGCSMEVSLSLAVVEAKRGAADQLATAPSMNAGAAQQLCADSSSEDEEEPAQATPIQPGPALELTIQEATLQGIGVQQLYRLVLDAGSELMRAHHAANDITGMVVGPWRAAPAGAGYQRVRSVSYTKKLNIPLPLAPERCQVWEEHRLLVKEAGGWVVLLVCTNDAPKGDCFEAHVQICGVYVDRNTSRLRVSMQLNWLKKTWGQGMVQNGAAQDAWRSYTALVQRLNQHAAGSGRGSSAGSELLVEQQPAATGDGAADVRSDAAKRGWWQDVQVLLRVALVLALLLLALAVVSAGRAISAELRSLTAALKESRA